MAMEMGNGMGKVNGDSLVVMMALDCHFSSFIIITSGGIKYSHLIAINF
jgi:hypothetical protein